MPRLVDERAIEELIAQARQAPRRRMNLNLHPQLGDPIQRLLNAGEPDTYVRPHRHRADRWELIITLRGRIDALFFDPSGRVTARHALLPGSSIEIPGGLWHGFVFAETGTVALEVKPGPYDAALDKEFVSWAPAEGEPGGPDCAAWLARAKVNEKY
ncbi:MAG TPA: WbuC family cupin fold metalloprotein [Stellaceae bacterium]|jgi:cupin fold WbuC family metalloprotein